ncbi:protein CNPPD1 [Eurosta solidaginis]|uniref:protein CNPPD1 n=1 Tax=Eurosta solidaginis TaxID=178769 RepID=UPI0035311D4D
MKMTYGRSARKRHMNGGGSCAATTKSGQVMPHGDFMDRIRKSLYFGSDALVEEMEVSLPLAEYASELFSAPHKGHSLNRLNTVAAGGVHASPCSLIMALIYLDRLNMSDPNYVRRITPQELFIVSMMVSTKFYAGYDEEIYLSDWAEDGHMSEKRLKKLELEFLCAIEWNIYISNVNFFEKLSSIEKQLARREGLRRGWLTYTELMQMLPSFTLAKFILNNIAVMAVSYAASVITIAGAFFLASQIPGTVLHRKAIATVIRGENVTTVLQSTAPVVAYDATPLNTQPRLRRTNKTEIAPITTVTVTEGNALNDTCTALNIEAELLKLECQYREEALREELRRRQHEIESATRLTLPDAVQHVASGNKKSKNAWYPTRFGIDLLRNWFTIKDEYAGEKFVNWLKPLQELEPAMPKENLLAAQENKQYEREFSNGWENWSLVNLTTSMFWQLLGDTSQQSFVSLPSMWPKFI